MLNVTIDEDSPELVIPEKVKRTLRDQAINEDGPGTILRDFETPLAFIGEGGLNTAGKYYFLPQGKLDELNQRMSRPAPHRLKRPQQRSFPHLHGLYLLLRASGLGIGTGSPPGGRLMIDKDLLAAWRELNSTERYFNGRRLRIACPYEEDSAAVTNEFALGDLPLPEGGTMTFLFDYGDDWRFSVKLEEVGPPKPRRTRPKVTARAGRAPAQYAGKADELW